MVEPQLLLKDRRKLIFSRGAPRRSLDDLRASDIVAGGNERSIASAAGREGSAADTRFDFAYIDENNRHVAVELKIGSRPRNEEIHRGLIQLKRYALSFTDKFDRAELWFFDKKASTLSIWSQDAQTPDETYGLINILSVDQQPWLADQKRIDLFDSNYVETRVHQWRDQVAQLFAQIADWSTAANYVVDQSSGLQMDEELMRLFAVSPVRLPIMKLRRGDKTIASVVPVGLWVIGANGRVDVLASKTSLIIVNESDAPNEVDWQAYSREKTNPQPLTQQLFLNFLALQ